MVESLDGRYLFTGDGVGVIKQLNINKMMVSRDFGRVHWEGVSGLEVGVDGVSLFSCG